ncbi:MAG TPA: protein kinase [Rhodanobacteraceae bacterium]|nr:protein kinase [Rhodanobacteraceae bacterium]
MSDVSDPATSGARLRELFEQIIDLAPEARAATLDAVAATPFERRQLAALLTADGGGGLLDTPAAEWAQRFEADDDDEVAAMVGQSIGPWRLVDWIGQGGSSVVFRAMRDLDGATQTAALKLLRTGLFSDEARRRFRRERAILTQISHPNLVRLIDGGVSEAGIPYIVMELVDGVPLTVYAADHGLDRGARLRLLAELGRTVDAAHRALIVHRDLKPSNILVDTSGRLKVLDFGIARLLDDQDEPATATQHRALTPGYAAPEQYRDGPLTTAVDVYALGVLAGELLIGCRLGADAAQPASADAATRESWRRLDADLATIVRAALASEPDCRYPSARHFADDIERHLRREPVSAHLPSRWYRTRKFVARHRGGVAMSGMFVAAIVAALGLALWQADVARSEAQRANSVRDFLVSVFEAARPAGPRLAPPSVAEVVRAGVAEARRSTQLDRTVRIELLGTLGAVLREQGDLDASVDLLEDNYRDALRNLGPAHAATVEAGLALARARMDSGARVEARETLDSILKYAPRSGDIQLRARALAVSAALHADQFEKQAALDQSAAAFALCERGCDLASRALVALIRGSTLAALHDDAAALAPLRQALALQRQLHGGPHVAIADVLQQLSRAERRLGRLQNAEALARESLAIVEASVPDPHMLRTEAMDTVRQVLIDEHKLVEAIALGERIIAMDIATLGPRHPSLATSYNTQGFTYGWMGDYAQAAVQYRAALAISEPIAENARRTAIYRSNLGAAVGMGGNAAAGMALVRQAIAEFRAQPEPDMGEIVSALEKLGELQRVAGDLEASEATFREAEAIYRRDLPAAPGAWYALTLAGLGRTLAEAGAYDEAARRLRAAIDLLPPAQASSLRVEAQATLAVVLAQQGDGAAAQRMLAEAQAGVLRLGIVKPEVRRLLERAAARIHPPAA